MSQENVNVVRQSWEGWVRDRWHGLVAYLDPEIVWDTSHFREWPESAYDGIEGVKRFLDEWLDVWEGYEAGVDEFLAAPDGRVVVLAWQRGKGRQSGLAMEMQWAQIDTVRNGKITRVDNYDNRIKAIEAAGLSE